MDALLELASTSVGGHATVGHVAGTALTFLLYEVSRFTCCEWFTRAFCAKTYDAMTVVDKRMWLSRMVSNMHVVTSLYFAFTAIFANRPAWEACGGTWDCGSLLVARGETDLNCQIALVNSAGYFVSDVVDLARTRWGLGYKKDSGPLVFGHHLSGIGASVATIYFNRGALLFIVWMLTELTTPFANGLYFFAKLNQPTLRTLSGMALLVGFATTRLPLSPLTGYYVLFHHREEYLTMPFYLLRYLEVLLGFATLMNYFWFWRILLGTLKAAGLVKKKMTADDAKYFSKAEGAKVD